MSDKVVLAYSGGLDTSVAIKWLSERYKLDVVALTIDVGNERDFSTIQQRALTGGCREGAGEGCQGCDWWYCPEAGRAGISRCQKNNWTGEF